MSSEKNNNNNNSIPVANATPVPARIIYQPPTAPASLSAPPAPVVVQGSSLHGGRHNPEREADTGIFRAFFCAYQAFSLNIRCRGTNEFLCLRKTACLECCECGPEGSGAKSRGVGILTDLHEDEYCRIACHCVDWALIKPKTCCASASHVLCMRQAMAFPPNHPDYLDELVCADYCISCLPKCCDIAAQPPKCPALDNMALELGVPPPAAAIAMAMDRGGDDYSAPVVVQGDYIKVAQEDDTDTDITETDNEVV